MGHHKQTNPTTTTIIIIMATTQQQQGTGTGMKKLAEKPTLLGEKQQDKLKIHGRTLLEFEVGPATDKTNLDELDRWLRGIKTSGIDEWTLSSKNDVGFGINKDDEVDWEDVRDLMLANRNLVQSVDLYGIHK